MITENAILSIGSSARYEAPSLLTMMYGLRVETILEAAVEIAFEDWTRPVSRDWNGTILTPSWCNNVVESLCQYHGLVTAIATSRSRKWRWPCVCHKRLWHIYPIHRGMEFKVCGMCASGVRSSGAKMYQKKRFNIILY